MTLETRTTEGSIVHACTLTADSSVELDPRITSGARLASIATRDSTMDNDVPLRSVGDMPPLHFLGGGVRISHTETQGDYCLLEASAPPGDVTPWHVHHHDDEGFYILEGVLQLRVGTRSLRLRAGDSALAPRGVPHAWLVESEVPARWLNSSNGGLERFARAVDSAGIEHVDRIAKEHGIELLASTDADGDDPVVS